MVREGLAFTGMMAVVIITAAAVSAASPDLLGTQHVPNSPAQSIPMPKSGPVPTMPSSPANDVAPALPSEVPSMSPSIPFPTRPASPVPPAESPGPQPTFTPPVPNPPPPSDPCPVGLAIDPILGVCVAT